MIFVCLCLCFLSCSSDELPILNIISEDIGWDEKQPCTVAYVDHQDSVVIKGDIKCRGGYSSKYFKHSWSLELHEKVNLANLKKEDDWIVNANYIDKTFMRHKLSYELFRQMSPINVASECEFVEVYRNSKYHGLYVLMQKLTAKTVGVLKEDGEGLLLKDPPIFNSLKPDSMNISENYYNQKYPKFKKENRSNEIEKLMQFLNHTSDKEFADEIEVWFDLENVMDWHLLLLLTNNSDGILKNFYLYKIDRDSPFRFAIWDYDHSFGRDGDGELNMMAHTIDCDRSILLKRLMSVKKDYNIQLKNRWNVHRKNNVLSNKNLLKLIANYEREIKSKVDRNFDKWPVNEKWYYDDNNFEDEVNIVRQFISLRTKVLDEYFSEM